MIMEGYRNGAPFRLVNVTNAEMHLDPDKAILDKLERATADLVPGTYRIKQLARTGDNIRYLITEAA